MRVDEGRANSAHGADQGRGNAGHGEVAGGAGEQPTQRLDAGISASKRVGFPPCRIRVVLERRRCFVSCFYEYSVFGWKESSKQTKE